MLCRLVFSLCDEILLQVFNGLEKGCAEAMYLSLNNMIVIYHNSNAKIVDKM